MRVLITGATGFIGSQLATRLVGKYSTYGLVKADEFARNRVEGVEYVEADVSDYDQVSKAFQRIKPEVVVHLAGYAPVRFSYERPWDYSNVNYLGTVNAVEAAVRTGGVEQFVYASTAEVYGPQPESRPLTEEALPAPNSPYSISKLAGEYYVKYAQHKGINYTVLRATNTYGRSDALPSEARGYFIEKAVIGMLAEPRKDISFDGSGRSTRRFMYFPDHVDAYLAVIGQRKAHNETFNAAPAGPVVEVSRVAADIARLTEFKGSISWNANPRPIEPNHIDIRSDKINSVLGWKAKYSLPEGLAKTVAFWKDRLEKAG